MKRISVCCLVLVFLAALASAYMVHEEPEEIDEATRGKRQQNDVAVIDNVFNIPITTYKQSTTAERNLSPTNIGLIENGSEIPETTLKAVSKLNKNRQQSKYQETTSPLSKIETLQPKRNYDTTIPSVNDIERRHRVETKKRIEAQREQQRHYEEQLRRRRFELVLEHNKRMQDQIIQENKRPYSHIYRDPFGFNALTKWVVGPHGIFNGHAGHGDGHVYQFFNKEKPLHFEGNKQRDSQLQQQHNERNQDLGRSIPTKSTLPLSSTSTTANNNSITSTSTATPTHNYEVHEVVDEGINSFTWPNWFGIINALGRAVQTYSNERIQEKINPKKTKVKLNELPIQNKIAPKDEDHYKSKYAQARKSYNALEAELTGNEIDGDLESNENRLTLIERGEKVLFPNH